MNKKYFEELIEKAISSQKTDEEKLKYIQELDSLLKKYNESLKKAIAEIPE